MQGNPHDHPEEFEHIDADAVCEACSNVNPPGTLLCKVCGNNLRDQRIRRMQGGGPAEVAAPRFQVRRIVSGVLATAGLLAVIVLAFNVDTLESALQARIEASSDSGTEFSPELFWEGPESVRFESLAASLQSTPLTIEQASVQPQGAPLAKLDGFYVLKRSTDEAASVLGSACVKTDGEEVNFVARLAGGTEIRGIGEMSSDSVIQAYHIGIREPDNLYSDAYGLARNESSGALVCSGLFGAPEMPVDLVAIQIPESLLTSTSRPAEDAAEAAAAAEPMPAAEPAPVDSATAPADEAAPAAEPAPASTPAGGTAPQ